MARAAVRAARGADGRVTMTAPLRVALFTDTFAPQMNGVARTLARWHGELGKRGHETMVFTTTAPDADETERVRRCGSVTFWAYKELRLAPPVWSRAGRELARFKPDLVHAATPFGVGLVGRAAAKATGVPLVTSYHTSFTQYARFYGLGAIEAPGLAFLRWFHNGGRRTFVPTAAIAGELEAARFRGISLWSRGIDTSRFNPAFRDSSMRETTVGEQGVVVAYVGRLAAEKGIDVALRAMQEVVRRRPNTAFAAAGDGPDEIRCRKMSPTGSWFAGRLGGDRLSAFYSSADIFVFPSTTDTFGNVLLEAMASGLPVVAADVPQSREVVGDKAGVFARADDHVAFADAITSLIDDAARRSAMKMAALERAASLGWDAVFDRLVDDYRGVLRESRQQPEAKRADQPADDVLEPLA